MAKAKQSKKQRKVGRNAAFCLRYKNSRRREFNKAKRLRKHLQRFPADAVAIKALELL
jgi:hypothetical protein